MIDILSVIEAILFAAGESVPVARLSLILGVGEDEVLAVLLVHTHGHHLRVEDDGL